MKLPEHLRGRNNSRLFILRREANALAGFYGLPIYLVGSALLDCNTQPRDWDLRVEMPDEDFSARFAGGIDPVLAVGRWCDETLTGKWTEIRWRWSDACVKQSKAAAQNTALNIDFQIYPLSYARSRYKKEPRLRLDTKPRINGEEK